MTTEYRYFKLTGGSLREKHDAFVAERTRQIEAREALEKEFGASSCYGNSDTVAGLVFDAGKAPDGWRLVKGETNVFQPPKGKDGTALRKRLSNLPVWGSSVYHGKMAGGFGFYGGVAARGLRLVHIIFEEVGDEIILKVPAGENCKEGEKWTPPDDGCVEIKTSEFYQLKEALK